MDEIQEIENTCAYCGQPLSMPVGDDLLVGDCDACHTPMHQLCWDYNCQHSGDFSGHCPILGCPGTHLVNLRVEAEHSEQVLAAQGEAAHVLAGDDDEAVINTWHHLGMLLAATPDAGAWQRRVDLAQERLEAQAEIEAALHVGDEAAACELWQEHAPLLASHAPAQAVRAEIVAIQDRVAAQETFAAALASDDDTAICAAWDRHAAVLKTLSIGDTHRDREQLARVRLTAMGELNAAIVTGDDERILASWERHSRTLAAYPPARTLEPRVALARLRTEAMVALRGAVTDGGDRRIAETWWRWRSVLEGVQGLASLATFEELIARSEDQVGDYGELIRRSLGEEDDERAAVLYETYRAHRDRERAITPGPRPDTPDGFSEAEVARLAVALHRAGALVQLRSALAAVDRAAIVGIYTEHEAELMGCRNFSQAERRQVTAFRQAQLADQLKAALRRGDPQALVMLSQQLLAAGGRLSDAEQQSVLDAERLLQAIARLAAAIDIDEDLAIACAYDAVLLDTCPQVTEEARERARLALARLACLPLLRLALAEEDDAALARLFDPDLWEGCPLLGPDERSRAALAQLRIAAYRRLHDAIQSGADERIVQAYHAELLEPSGLLQPAERTVIAQAAARLAGLHALSTALAEGDNAAIVKGYEQAAAAGACLPAAIDWATVVRALGEVRRSAELYAALAGEDETLERELAAGRLTLAGKAAQDLPERQRAHLAAVFRKLGSAARVSA